MLDKTYDPARVEGKHYARWEKAGSFKHAQNISEDAFTIVIPPPNVTGRLHMGHALNNTLQDVMIRHKRMQGLDVLWQPGTDHAGIATQMVVERKLAEQGIKRRDLGREKFLEKIWQWKDESGGTISNQLRRLGASCDWSRERFTMDEGLTAAVLDVFVRLYKEGLIYKDKRLVNWDPAFETAISDLEVIQKEVQGHMWHFKYPVEGEEGVFLTVATTRPETMLGDSGVAVHPDDARYKHLVGKNCIHPLTGFKLTIVADDYADPEQGTGAVKMTPAHDFNDFEIGRRHHLEMINVMTPSAHMNDQVPEKYRGMDRFQCREAVIADMQALGCYAGKEDHVYMVPYGDRGGAPIEPYLTDQWFVDAKTLAGPAIKSVEEGRTGFVPENWTKTYYEWMRNIQPWCISRQLWWGHQIPAWYGPDGETFVEKTEAEAIRAAEKHYGKAVELSRDEDVLDTWFSSALWPFSTLGWPDDTPELVAKHYPTDVLVTGFDIIFFWVARMMMMGLKFMGREPFHTVYVHALVRDENGQKMSKSKGNVIDPLELVEQYGADALRFTLASMAAPGRDIKLATSRVAGNRNFTTKIWNAARFCEMNQCVVSDDFDPTKAKQAVNRWIVGEVAKRRMEIDHALSAYRFNDAAGVVYQFVWGRFCDWYLELVKPLLNSDDEAVKAETRKVAGWSLAQILKLLHPFMPFVTEEIWEKCGDKPGQLLITSEWPRYGEDLINADVVKEMEWVIGVIGGIRSVRAEMNIPPSVQIPMILNGASAQTKGWLETHWALLSRLARLSDFSLDAVPPKAALELVHDGATVALPIADVIDLGQEKARLEKAVKKVEAGLRKISDKLSNPKFLANAPEAVIAENKQRLETEKDACDKLKTSLAKISAVM